MTPMTQTTPGGFSEEEEEFFRAGIAMSQVEPVETFEDLEAGYQPTGLWQRLFSRRR
jgi:hypothetical protein